MAPPTMEKPKEHVDAADESAEEDASNNSASAEETTPLRKKKTRKGKKALQKSSGSSSALKGVDYQRQQQQQQQQQMQQQQQQQPQEQGGGGKSDTLKLRLDLNLEIEIQLKARIHGDLELALLYVLSTFTLFPLFLFIQAPDFERSSLRNQETCKSKSLSPHPRDTLWPIILLREPFSTALDEAINTYISNPNINNQQNVQPRFETSDISSKANNTFPLPCRHAETETPNKCCLH